MTNKTENEKFVGEIKAALDASVAGMDLATRSRLSAIRYQALQAKQRLPMWRPSLVPATVFAVAFATMVIFGSFGQQAQIAPGFDDLEMLSAAEFDLLDELEFYQWLDTVAVDASHGEHAEQGVPLGLRMTNGARMRVNET